MDTCWCVNTVESMGDEIEKEREREREREREKRKTLRQHMCIIFSRKRHHEVEEKRLTKN